MNSGGERVWCGGKPYQSSRRGDLAACCVDSEEFEDWKEVEDNNGDLVADFNEVVCIVEKDWLFDKIRKETGKEPRHYLCDVYTSDDSYDWFIDAKTEGKLVMVNIN